MKIINKKVKKNIKCKKQYIDEMGKYNSISTKYIPQYYYSIYKENNKFILLIRVEIPGNIQNLTASYIKYGKKKAIQIKGEKLKDNYPEMKKKSFIEIKDVRNYEEIRYLIDLQEEIEIYQETPIEKIEIYEFEFNRNNIEPKNNNHTEDDDDEEDNEKNKQTENESESIKIASGIYAFKFMITKPTFDNITKRYKKDK